MKTLSLLAMQIAARDNEVAGEEAVLGELQTAKSATEGRLPNLCFRKFLSKLPGIISSQGPLTLLFVFLLTLCAERHKTPSSLALASVYLFSCLVLSPCPFPLSILFLFLFLHKTYWYGFGTRCILGPDSHSAHWLSGTDGQACQLWRTTATLPANCHPILRALRLLE